MYQNVVKYTKWSLNIPSSSISIPYKIYPNRDFWFENKPFGNPGQGTKHAVLKLCNLQPCHKRQKHNNDITVFSPKRLPFEPTKGQL
jgi:hypothetical protein